MNKKITTLLLLASVALTASAQIPTLTSTSNPIAGDWYLHYATDTFNQGASGAMVTWDFHTLPLHSTDTAYWSACSASPLCSTFPGTTVYGHQQGSTLGVYLHTTTTSQSVDGEYNTGAIPFSNYEDLLRYPFTYGTTYVDTMIATFTSGSSFYRSGTITVTGDAYGTLILPNATFTNALRVHRVEDYKDSIVGVATMYTYHSDIYSWNVPNIRTEVLNVTRFSANGTPLANTAWYTNKQPVSVESAYPIQPSVLLYPNPARDNITIQLSTDAAHIRVSIADVMGETIAIIADDYYSQGAHIFNFNTGSLSRGIYFIKLQTDTQCLTRKIELN
jgi:hypothetical protein